MGFGTTGLITTNKANMLEMMLASKLIPGRKYLINDAVNGGQITGVNQGTKTFTIAAGPLPSSQLAAGQTINVIDSTGNNGTYTVSSVTPGLGTIAVVVVQAIPSATANGYFNYIEGLILESSTTTTLGPSAISTTHASDTILYDTFETTGPFSAYLLWSITYRRSNLSVGGFPATIIQAAVPWDFRNITWNRWETVAGNGIYTSSTPTAGALKSFYTFGNSIDPTGPTFTPAINGNQNATDIIVGQNSENFIFGTNVDNIVIGQGSNGGTISNSCQNISIGDACSSLLISSSSQNIIAGSGFTGNNIGASCIQLIFGNGCSTNNIGASVQYLKAGNVFSNNTIGTSCTYNTFGFNCGSNQIAANCLGNIFSDNCNSNSLVSNFNNNVLYEGFTSNITHSPFQNVITLAPVNGLNFTVGVIVATTYTKTIVQRSDASYQLYYLDGTNTVQYVVPNS